MYSDKKSVDEYIAAQSDANRALLTQLRQAILSAAPTAVESMMYKMPTYSVGQNVFAFAVQKHCISLYVNQEELITKYAKNIGKHKRGKNCIRYEKPEDVDFDDLRKLIRKAYDGRG